MSVASLELFFLFSSRTACSTFVHSHDPLEQPVHVAFIGLQQWNETLPTTCGSFRPQARSLPSRIFGHFIFFCLHGATLAQGRVGAERG